MMKKTIVTLIIAGLAATSGFSHAADNTVTQISSGVYVENDATGCSVLRDRVTVNTSTNVTLAYNCLTASNKVNLAGCHSAGSQKPTRVTCSVVGEDDDNEPIFNVTGCTPEGQLEDPVQSVEISGRRAYIASTTGGSVSATSLDSTTCNIGALSGLAAIAQ